MFNIGLFKTLRDLIQGFSGYISAFNRTGNMADKICEAGEKSVELMLEEIERSRAKARQDFLEASTQPSQP